MIEVKHLTKRYGDHLAVSDLNFTIDKGKIYGLLGPNGAGKSTTMNIMTGCLSASEGDVKIGGYDIFEQPDKAKKLIGYLPEQPPLYIDQTPREYLTFVARAKGIAEKDIDEKIKEVMSVTQISDVSDRLIKQLSKGYRQRVGIAQAILGDPDIIILDEPTVGLDPRQIIEIRDLIRGLGQKHTVILSSHILSEVQAVCEIIMIISKGKLVACDTGENLEKMFSASSSVEITVEADEENIRKILSPLSYITTMEITEKETGKFSVHINTGIKDTDKVCRDIFFAFSEAGFAILGMNTSKASLEDIFIELTEEDDNIESHIQA